MSKGDLLLAIDTSTTVVTVAIGSADRVLATRSVPTERRHAEVLAPTIREAVSDAAVELHVLAAIAAGLGPGLFTGLRVGVTTVKAMAQALGIPTVGLSTLDVLAASAGADRVVAVLDARRREVFWAHYEQAERTSDDRVGPARELRRELVTPVTLVGDGAAVAAAELTGPGVTISHVVAPDPGLLVEMGADAWARGDARDPAALVPRYVRRADAEIQSTFEGPVTETVTEASNVGGAMGEER